MATFEELVARAKKADAAGDTKAAKALLDVARGMMATSPQSGRFAPQPSPAEPPRAEDNGTGRPATDTAAPFGTGMAALSAEPRAAMGQYATALFLDASKSPSANWLQQQNLGLNPLDVGVLGAAGDIGGLALSTIGATYGAGVGLATDTAGALGMGGNSQRKLARDMMVMPEAFAGVSGMAAGMGAGVKAPVAARAATEGELSARAAQKLGITPSLGMSGKAGALAASVAEKSPLTAGAIGRDAARAVAAIEGAVAGATGRVGAAGGPLRAGDKLQSGLRAYVDAFKTRSESMFGEVDRMIPKGMPVRLDSTAATVSEAQRYFAGQPQLAEKLGLTKWNAIIEEAGKNGTNWQAVRQLRTMIGEAIGTNRGILADEDLGRLKAMYGALTDDMTAAAKAAGPDAYAKWKGANNYYAGASSKIEDYLDQTISAKSPERAFEAFVAMTKNDRVSSDVTRMRKIKTSMPAREWNDVAASIIDRLGKAPAGQQGAMGDRFSPATFLTEWNKMSPEAKTLIVPADVRLELEQIARVSERVKAAGAEKSTGSAPANMMAAQMATIGAGLVSHPYITMGMLGAANVSARFLTAPSVLKYINEWNTGQKQGLTAMARGRGPYAADAAELLRLMAAETANANNPPNEKAYK